MKIIEALRVANHEAVAIVGAGGKTSLMFALAEAAPKPVCLTTTTKLAREECQGNFNHRLFSEFEVVPAASLERAKINFITNPLDSSGQKWLGLSIDQAEKLIAYCRSSNILCLIEADGARHSSLKAPAAWEPVVPNQVDLVIVVVGISAIGKLLNAETVFQPELFSNLTGLTIGAPIQLGHIVSLLNHPEGGLQGIPQKSRAAVVFNQADAYSLKPDELDLVQRTLRAHYSTAILTSLRTDREHCEVIFHRD